MKRVLCLVLMVVSCGSEIVVVEPAPTTTAPLGGVPTWRKPEKECSVKDEIRALSRQAVGVDEAFKQCLKLANAHEAVCHQLCNPS